MSLVRAIKRITSSKHEVVERIFEWITRNITYDIEAFSNKRQSTTNGDINDLVVRVVNSRKALCFGYSHLFQMLCG